MPKYSDGPLYIVALEKKDKIKRGFFGCKYIEEYKRTSGSFESKYSAEEMNNNLYPPSNNRLKRFFSPILSCLTCTKGHEYRYVEVKPHSKDNNSVLAQNANSLFYHQAPYSAALNDALNNDEVKQSNSSAYI